MLRSSSKVNIYPSSHFRLSPNTSPARRTPGLSHQRLYWPVSSTSGPPRAHLFVVPVMWHARYRLQWRTCRGYGLKSTATTLCPRHLRSRLISLINASPTTYAPSFILGRITSLLAYGTHPTAGGIMTGCGGSVHPNVITFKTLMNSFGMAPAVRFFSYLSSQRSLMYIVRPVWL